MLQLLQFTVCSIRVETKSTGNDDLRCAKCFTLNQLKNHLNQIFVSFFSIHETKTNRFCFFFVAEFGKVIVNSFMRHTEVSAHFQYN